MQATVPPPLVAALVALLMKLITMGGMALPFGNGWPRIAAILLVITGVGIAIAGIVQFRRHQTTVDPLNPDRASALVTDGIFTRTRNPMYLGLLLGLIGYGFWLASISALVIALVFIPLITASQISTEERVMEDLFGDAYLSYKHRTRRWL